MNATCRNAKVGFGGLLCLITLLTLGPATTLYGQSSTGDPGVAFGVALGMHNPEPGADYRGHLWEIARLGAGHVSLVVAWCQQRVTSSELSPCDATASDASVIEAMRYAEALGLDVMLFPLIVMQETAPGQWRGTMQPEPIDRWWQQYEDFILHYARLAASHGVETYSVGSELGSMEQDLDRWLTLIRRVRAVFAGDVIYSANWDRAHETPFWDALDAVGVSAYFELRTGDDGDEGDLPARAALVDAWQVHRASLVTLANAHDRPLVLTEIGYPSIASAADEPWNYMVEAPLALTLQARLFDVAFEVLRGMDELSRVYVWSWYDEGGPQSRGYTPRRKPAAAVLRQWFAGESERGSLPDFNTEY